MSQLMAGVDFIPGLQLNKAFYWDAVRPIFDRVAPGLRHAAALVGYGSDVIGFDTVESTDHQWGPRLEIFLTPEEVSERTGQLHEALRQQLPINFRGYSTHFSAPGYDGVRCMQPIEQGPVDHLVQFHTIDGFWQNEIGLPAFAVLEPQDWLTLSEHKLLSLTAGEVFYDTLGLEEARRKFAYYPRDVWLYLLAAQWALLTQEEAFPGRTAGLGDELGCRVIVARECERLMRLCFLMERRYAPYSKWFGSAFQRLESYPRIGPLLQKALSESDHRKATLCLTQACGVAGEIHNELGISSPVDPLPRTFSEWHGFFNGQPVVETEPSTRPYPVICAWRFAKAIREAIVDPKVLMLTPNIGSINQFMTESSEALQSVEFGRRLRDDLVKE